MLTRKAFHYRLYPTRTQEHTLLFVLRRCRHLYNSALEQLKRVLPDAPQEFGVHAAGC